VKEKGGGRSLGNTLVFAFSTVLIQTRCHDPRTTTHSNPPDFTEFSDHLGIAEFAYRGIARPAEGCCAYVTRFA
jgi:hypothetical protein